VYVVLATDTGGTSTRLAVQSLDGVELDRCVLDTNPHDYGSAMKAIAEAGHSLIRGRELLAVGSGVAGVIDGGVLTDSGNLPGWKGHDVETDLRQAFDAPVAVLNDAQVAGLGELTALKSPLVYVIWGSGVGVALVVDGNGQIVALATELGHIVIDKNSKLRCGCGGYGHLEAHVSGNNIPKRRFGRRRGLRAEHLNDRQWGVVCRDMAIGLRSISAAAPGLPIVMGGGITNKQSHRLPILQEMVGQLKSSCPVPMLHLAKHGEDSGLVGAGFAARQLVRA
jgi:predicted NBD/HSP70 family sugar kinase